MKYIYKIIIGLLFIFSANNVSAADLILVPSKDNVAIGEEFYVDIKINIGDESINGIEGVILYDNTQLEFVRSLNSKSFITHWINEPKNAENGRIIFSGIEPNGFGGFLNKPSDTPNNGVITRIVFKPIREGSSVVGVQNVFTTANDGEGSIVELKAVGSLVQVNGNVNNVAYNVVDINNPILTAEIIKDENLYNGTTTLVFNAIDKDSGVEGVYVKIKKDWVKINNPYELKSHNSGAVLVVKAVDYAGNSNVVRFLLPGYGVNLYNGIAVLLIIVIAVVLFRYLYKKYVKNKKHL
jgi:hypothetical protein